MIKVDLVTGFLGSGKTTFIKKYAEYLVRSGEHVGILENDYGAVNVDMLLLNELRSENCELEMVAGGCDTDCHRRRFKTKLISMAMSGYTRVVIEPSGIFDMDEFFDALREPPLDNWYEIGSVFCIVDATLDTDISDETRYILAGQAADAGRIILSRVQDTDSAHIEKIKDFLNEAVAHLSASGPMGAGSGVSGSAGTGSGALESAGTCSGVSGSAGTGLGASGFAGTGSGALDIMASKSTPPVRALKDRDFLAVDWKDLTDVELCKLKNAGYMVKDFVKKYDLDHISYGSLCYLEPGKSLDELRVIAGILLGLDGEGGTPGSDGKGSAAYLGSDGKESAADPGSDGKGSAAYPGSDGKESAADSGSDGKGSAAYPGSDGNENTASSCSDSNENAVSAFGHVIRVKGFVQEKGGWIQMNATRHGIETKPIDQGQEVFIVIGENLDRDRIDKLVAGDRKVWKA